ncbi:MAG: leucine-rich repeat domain-containing protein, partial [Muribaculaceae bacterium]|nr:leucine-rich repeat domain-containing protein [Muribaculaceae bacterium]
LTSIEIPNSVTSIGFTAFFICSGLTSIEIPNSVTSIRSEAFAFCSGLTSIEIPNSVTEIWSRCFRHCSSLTSVTLSENLESISSNAFEGCDAIETIIYPAIKPCKADKSMFTSNVYDNAILYVPDEAVNTFKSTAPWSSFYDIRGLESSGIEDVMDNSGSGEIDYTAPYDVYNLNGAKVGNAIDILAPGLYIIRQGSVAKKIALN